jgi:hypothetical protein
VPVPAGTKGLTRFRNVCSDCKHSWFGSWTQRLSQGVACSTKEDLPSAAVRAREGPAAVATILKAIDEARRIRLKLRVRAARMAMTSRL